MVGVAGFEGVEEWVQGGEEGGGGGEDLRGDEEDVGFGD